MGRRAVPKVDYGYLSCSTILTDEGEACTGVYKEVHVRKNRLGRTCVGKGYLTELESGTNGPPEVCTEIEIRRQEYNE